MVSFGAMEPADNQLRVDLDSHLVFISLKYAIQWKEMKCYSQIVLIKHV